MEWMRKRTKVDILKTTDLYTFKWMNFIACELWLDNKIIENKWR